MAGQALTLRSLFGAAHRRESRNVPFSHQEGAGLVLLRLQFNWVTLHQPGCSAKHMLKKGKVTPQREGGLSGRESLIPILVAQQGPTPDSSTLGMLLGLGGNKSP